MAGYFDVSNSNTGFTMRFHYDNSTAGYITITNIQLQSTQFGGTWYPKGDLIINGETVFSMSYTSPATNSFYISTAGSTWYNIAEANSSGNKLPVTNSTPITASSISYSINLELYRSSDGNIVTFPSSGSGTITATPLSGLVYIDNGTSFDAYEVYIDNGSSWDLYQVYVDNGSSWDAYG